MCSVRAPRVRSQVSVFVKPTRIRTASHIRYVRDMVREFSTRVSATNMNPCSRAHAHTRTHTHTHTHAVHRRTHIQNNTHMYDRAYAITHMSTQIDKHTCIHTHRTVVSAAWLHSLCWSWR